MTRRKVWRWFAAGTIGVMLATCAGLWFLPGTGPTSSVLPVEMAPIRTESGDLWVPPPAPPPVAQSVPEDPIFEGDATEHWERVHDRADWVGGATVTCDLGDLADHAVTAHLDMDQGIRLEGTVDVMSRMYTPVDDNRVTFAVKKPDGEARLMLGIVTDRSADRDEWEGPPDPESFDSRPLRVRWHGAEPGTTVGCDAAWEVGAAKLAVLVRDTDGNEVEPGPESMAVLKGCGAMVPVAVNPIEFQVEAGTCVLQVERRSANFPLIVARSAPTTIRAAPGELREITMTLPDPPPMYQPPDLLELATAADMAAFFGADVAADAIEELIDKVLAGDWDADLIEQIARSMRGGDELETEFEVVAEDISPEDFEQFDIEDLEEGAAPDLIIEGGPVDGP